MDPDLARSLLSGQQEPAVGHVGGALPQSNRTQGAIDSGLNDANSAMDPDLARSLMGGFQTNAGNMPPGVALSDVKPAPKNVSTPRNALRRKSRHAPVQPYELLHSVYYYGNPVRQVRSRPNPHKTPRDKPRNPMPTPLPYTPRSPNDTGPTTTPGPFGLPAGMRALQPSPFYGLLPYAALRDPPPEAFWYDPTKYYCNYDLSCLRCGGVSSNCVCEDNTWGPKSTREHCCTIL